MSDSVAGLIPDDDDDQEWRDVYHEEDNVCKQEEFCTEGFDCPCQNKSPYCMDGMPPSISIMEEQAVWNIIFDNWYCSRRPTKVPAGSDHYFHLDCRSVHPNFLN